MMFDEKTTIFLANKNRAMVYALEKGIIMLYEAKKMELEAAKAMKKAKDSMLPLLLAIDAKEGLSIPDLGTVNLIQDVEVGKKISRDAMEKYLLDHGVAPTLLAKARANATSKSVIQDQVRFKIAKTD